MEYGVRRRRPRDRRPTSGVERLRGPHQHSQVRIPGIYFFLPSKIKIQTEDENIFKNKLNCSISN
jgi:hypothetical protein